jgi:hypothetical protein
MQEIDKSRRLVLKPGGFERIISVNIGLDHDAGPGSLVKGPLWQGDPRAS